MVWLRLDGLEMRKLLFASIGLMSVLAGASAEESRCLDLCTDLGAAIEEFRQDYDVPGVGVAVVWGDDAEYVAGHGYANLEDKIPATAETKFRIASVTKSMVALGVLHLVDMGRLRLDDPIEKFFGDLVPEDKRGITISQLMAHTTGMAQAEDDIVDPNPEQPLDGYFIGTNEEYIRRILSAPLLLAPNEVRDYHNGPWLMAGEIIEIVAKQPYDTYIAENILSHVGMSETQTFEPTEVVPRQATGYYVAENGVMNRQNLFEVLSEPWGQSGMGGFWSTPRDMAAYSRAWLDRSFPLSKGSFSRMLRESAEPRTAVFFPYSFGVSLNNWNGAPTLAHGGHNDGWRTMWIVFPNRGIGVTVMVNIDYRHQLDYVPVHQFAYELAAIVDPSLRQPKPLTNQRSVTTRAVLDTLMSMATPTVDGETSAYATASRTLTNNFSEAGRAWLADDGRMWEQFLREWHAEMPKGEEPELLLLAAELRAEGGEVLTYSHRRDWIGTPEAPAGANILNVHLDIAGKIDRMTMQSYN